MPTLFDPISLGAIDAKNRILMAPLTRGRAGSSRTANALMAEYYAQRASSGLMITEATAIDASGYGWANAPAMYTDAQQAGWAQVTDAVHKAGGRMVLQLWHMGRVSHPDFLRGHVADETPVAPSAIRAEGESHTPDGQKKPYVTPRALTIDEIKRLVDAYAMGAKRAIAAGFDGVEIHAANGYLIDQFLRDGSNQRSDAYGGSAENRLRFLRDIVQAVTADIGSDRTGLRLSPTGGYNDMRDSDPHTHFTYFAKELDAFNLAYLHVLEPLDGHPFAGPTPAQGRLLPAIRKVYRGALITNGGYDAISGQIVLDEGLADAVAYGVPLLSTPDLVARYRAGLAANEPDFSTFYTEGAKGYTDYPTLEQLKAA